MNILFLALAILSFFTTLSHSSRGLQTCEWCQPTDVTGKRPSNLLPYLTCYECDDGRRGMTGPLTITFDEYIGNSFGTLVPKMGGYMASCPRTWSDNITGAFPQDFVVRAGCDDGSGTKPPQTKGSTFRLDDYVSNVKGKLVWDW